MKPVQWMKNQRGAGKSGLFFLIIFVAALFFGGKYIMAWMEIRGFRSDLQMYTIEIPKVRDIEVIQSKVEDIASAHNISIMPHNDENGEETKIEVDMQKGSITLTGAYRLNFYAFTRDWIFDIFVTIGETHR